MRTSFEPRLQLSFVAAGGLIATVGVGLLTADSQKKQASKINANNPYPTQDVPQAEKDNQQIAAQMANEGLPSQQYAMAMKNIQRNRSAALRSAGDRKAGVGLIGGIQQQADDSTARLDAANAQARLDNKRQQLGVNNKVAAYQNDAFNWNQKNRYNQQYEYAQKLQGAANANTIGAIDSGLSGLVGLAGRGAFGNKNPYGGGSDTPDFSGISDDELLNA